MNRRSRPPRLSDSKIWRVLSRENENSAADEPNGRGSSFASSVIHVRTVTVRSNSGIPNGWMSSNSSFSTCRSAANVTTSA
jgi:hypothetical protein